MKHIKIFENFVNEAGWDSFQDNIKIIKIDGEKAKVSIRYVYDTPNYVAAELYIAPGPKALKALGITEDDYDAFPGILLMGASKENSKINTREMDDTDVYDLFNTKIQKALDSLNDVDPKKIIKAAIRRNKNKYY